MNLASIAACTAETAAPFVPVSFTAMPSAPTAFRSTSGTQHGDSSTGAFRKTNTGATVNLVFDGDSITATNYLHSPFPAKVWRGLAAAGTSAHFSNFAVAGQKLSDMTTDGVAQVDSVLVPGLKNILFVFAGTNDLAFEAITAATCHTRMSTYCAARKAAGWTVIACTMIRRKQTDVTYTEVTDFNALVVANYATYANVLCNWSGDTAFSNEANTTYYLADQIHPNQGGHDVLATYATTALNAALLI